MRIGLALGLSLLASVTPIFYILVTVDRALLTDSTHVKGKIPTSDIHDFTFGQCSPPSQPLRFSRVARSLPVLD